MGQVILQLANAKKSIKKQLMINIFQNFCLWAIQNYISLYVILFQKVQINSYSRANLWIKTSVLRKKNKEKTVKNI